MEAHLLAPFGLERAEAGAGAMLVACRSTGLISFFLPFF